VEFNEVIRNRHAVRDFSQEPVADDALQRILDAAQLAPSAMNSQPWRFYVARGEARQQLGRAIAQTTVHLSEYMDVLGPERYEEAVKWYSSLGDAPVVIVITMVHPEDEFNALNLQLSVGAAIENMLLAVTNEGLGACNVTFSFWVRDDISEIVGAGADEDVVSIVALGHPGEKPPAAPEHDLHHAVFLD